MSEVFKISFNVLTDEEACKTMIDELSKGLGQDARDWKYEEVKEKAFPYKLPMKNGICKNCMEQNDCSVSADLEQWQRVCEKAGGEKAVNDIDRHEFYVKPPIVQGEGEEACLVGCARFQKIN